MKANYSEFRQKTLGFFSFSWDLNKAFGIPPPELSGPTYVCIQIFLFFLLLKLIFVLAELCHISDGSLIGICSSPQSDLHNVGDWESLFHQSQELLEYESFYEMSKKGDEVKHQKCPFQVSWWMSLWVVMVIGEKMENREEIE